MDAGSIQSVIASRLPRRARWLIGNATLDFSLHNELIAGQAAGTDHEEARRVLGSYARSADDETFCKTAQRHLDAGPTPSGAILSAESRATIAAIERPLGKRNGLRADTIAL